MSATRHGTIRRLYERLGRRYVRTVLVLVFLLFYVVYLLGLAVLAIYVDMSGAEFLRLLLVMIVVEGAYTISMPLLIGRMLRPVKQWLDGSHDQETTLAAWTAAAGVPLGWLRELGRHWLPLPGFVAFAAYTVWDLNLSTSSFFILLGAIGVVTLYGISIVFFTLEQAMRPLVEALARELPPDAHPEASILPLRTRLVVTLSAVNVVAGVLVAALSPRGTELADLGVVILIALAAAFTGGLWVTVLLADSIVTPVRELRLATERVAAGDLGARALLLSTDETGELTRSFNRMAVGLQERERLRHAFGAFVDPLLAERVLREGTDLAGEKVELSVLFLDVRGFTSLSERAGAREVVAMLNDLWDHVVPIVLHHGGHANKFIGDGMLAIFGAPDRLPDHADRAVQAGIEIADAVAARYEGSLRVGVGVNTGRVLVGTVGGGGRLDFTVIGDVVNTASRIESATRQTGDDVLISEFTYAALTSGWDAFEPRPSLPLKGKAEPVALYAPTASGARLA